MRVILIGNFLPDKQESMARFAQMLQLGFNEAGYETEIWYPQPYFSAWSKFTITGLGKWLGYIDKWVIFPIILRWRLLYIRVNNSDVSFHICDHSNALYLKHLPIDRTVITCHDVLAIRGAMGYTDAYCPAKSTGKILQRWILNNLRRAKRLAAVSQLTLNQLEELSSSQQLNQREWRVIHNAFNADFNPVPENQQSTLLSKFRLQATESFILHVGSALPRKNRKLLLDMVAILGSKWSGRICFAGQSLDETLIAHADSLGLKDRLIGVEEPDHETLVALYSACDAFIFPSFSEGFGWPIIEAQACGAPVITSIIEPMPEVSGGAALYADPLQPQAFANAFYSLQDEGVRLDLIQRGFVNCKRFELGRMINKYLDLHEVERY